MNLTCKHGEQIKVKDLIWYVAHSLKGDDGDRGPMGPVGAHGPTAYQEWLTKHTNGIPNVGKSYAEYQLTLKGDTGPVGASVHLMGSLPLKTILGKTGKDGQMYMSTTDGHDHNGHVIHSGDSVVWFKSNWEYGGHIRGPAGPQGPLGSAGHNVLFYGEKPLAEILKLKGPVGVVYFSSTDVVGETDQSAHPRQIHIGDGLQYVNGKWHYAGHFRGPAGPQGIQGLIGPRGLDAYHEWVAHQKSTVTPIPTDAELTYAKYQLTLKGPKGDTGHDGVDGLSAYQYWVNHGHPNAPLLPDGKPDTSLAGFQSAIRGHDGGGYVHAEIKTTGPKVGHLYLTPIQSGVSKTPVDIGQVVGPSGAAGHKGDKGDAGAVGHKGDRGPQGVKGLAGHKGDAGPIGHTGPAGNDGHVGAKGDKGDAGQRGLTGNTGHIGVDGPKGDAGPIGHDGDRGSAIYAVGSAKDIADLIASGYKPHPHDLILATHPFSGKIDPANPEIHFKKGDLYTLPDPIGGAKFAGNINGAIGATGHAGAAGHKGDAGPIGHTGPAGADGHIGPIGHTGPAGNDGHVGAKGQDGTDGAKGDTGATGAAGHKGDIGPIGHTGPAGADGHIGPDGHAGAKGDKGDKGQDGTDGAKGATGLTGAVGHKGDAGPIGHTGPAGADGHIGADGHVGAKGDKGDAGKDGTDGVKGDTGLTGAVGHVGAKGDTGKTGPAGAVGHKGDAGANGHVGAKGDKGDAGKDGHVGAKGDKGDAGAVGHIGPDGKAGAKGDAGVIGHTGPTGHVGPRGLQGLGLEFEHAFADLATLKLKQGTGTTMGVNGKHPELGEVHLTTDTGDLWVFDNLIPPHTDVSKAAWHSVGHVRGPTGPAGHVGAKGDAGVIGHTGATGHAGPTGPAGHVGAKGNTGVGFHGVINQGQLSAIPHGEKVIITKNFGTYKAGDILGWHGGTENKWVKYSSLVGPIGHTGAKGDAGHTGAKGDAGPIGHVGPDGKAGPTGPAGHVGAKGDKGDIGKTGAAGGDGKDGAKGLTGSTGPAGHKGAKGDAGPIGHDGPAGHIGPDGHKGDKGDKGNSFQGVLSQAELDKLRKGIDKAVVVKSSGFGKYKVGDVLDYHSAHKTWDKIASVIGPIGHTGATGHAGHKGDKGDAGPIGHTGPAGHIGPDGHKGDKGDKGNKGYGVHTLWTDVALAKIPKTGKETVFASRDFGKFKAGDMLLYSIRNKVWYVAGHLVGPTGHTGATGPAGHKGAKGDAGPIGHDGPAGHVGAAGHKGDKGDTGDKGHIGLTGATGHAGATGNKGDKGESIRIEGSTNDVNWLKKAGGALVLGGRHEGTIIISQVAQTATDAKNKPIHKGDAFMVRNIGHGKLGWVNIGQMVGDKGNTGATGAAGHNGHTGAKGDTGPIGHVGPAGHIGPDGKIGPRGLAGPVGHIGPNGHDGHKGADGVHGVDGIGYTEAKTVAGELWLKRAGVWVKVAGGKIQTNMVFASRVELVGGSTSNKAIDPATLRLPEIMRQYPSLLTSKIVDLNLFVDLGITHTWGSKAKNRPLSKAGTPYDGVLMVVKPDTNGNGLIKQIFYEGTTAGDVWVRTRSGTKHHWSEWDRQLNNRTGMEQIRGLIDVDLDPPLTVLMGMYVGQHKRMHGGPNLPTTGWYNVEFHGQTATTGEFSWVAKEILAPFREYRGVSKTPADTPTWIQVPTVAYMYSKAEANAKFAKSSTQPAFAGYGDVITLSNPKGNVIISPSALKDPQLLRARAIISSTKSDLNNITATGMYFQEANHGAGDKNTDAHNYPVHRAGVLTVKNTLNAEGGGAKMIWQEYHTYGNDNNIKDDVYQRAQSGTGWSTWVKQLSTRDIATTAQVAAGTSSSLLVTPKAIAAAYMLKSAGLTATEADNRYVRNDRDGQIQGSLELDNKLVVYGGSKINSALVYKDGQSEKSMMIYSDHTSRDAHWNVFNTKGGYVTGITLSQNGHAYLTKEGDAPHQIALLSDIHNVIAKKAASQHDVDSAVNVDKYVTPQTLGKPDIMMYKGYIGTGKNVTLDTFDKQGIYTSVSDHDVVKNRPENKAGVLVVTTRGTKDVHQTYNTYHNGTYTRVKSGGHWPATWTKLLTDEDLHKEHLKGGFDWNTLLTSGTYGVELPTGAHKPDSSTTWGILVISRSADKNNFVQTYTSGNGSGVIASRVHIGATWFPWKYHGTMSLNTANSTLTIRL